MSGKRCLRIQLTITRARIHGNFDWTGQIGFGVERYPYVTELWFDYGMGGHFTGVAMVLRALFCGFRIIGCTLYEYGQTLHRVSACMLAWFLSSLLLECLVYEPLNVWLMYPRDDGVTMDLDTDEPSKIVLSVVIDALRLIFLVLRWHCSVDPSTDCVQLLACVRL